jgi:hypothetical protein
MLPDTDQFSALLVALGYVVPKITFYELISFPSLGQGLFKPVPGLVSTMNDTVHTIYDSASGITSSLGLPLPGLPPLPIVGILDYRPSESASKVQNLATHKLKDPVNVEGFDSATCYIEPYSAPVEGTIFAPFDSVKANIYRYRQQQSVNLGSW